ncbi:rapsyn protein 1 [Aphelenchoides avenae]|nr:rapsyn protein 1 [Aphelenchus avenae]
MFLSDCCGSISGRGGKCVHDRAPLERRRIPHIPANVRHSFTGQGTAARLKSDGDRLRTPPLRGLIERLVVGGGASNSGSASMGIVFQESPMGQRYAKHQMQSGVRLYHQRHYQQAIHRWRSALHRLRSAEDRFITLGYMAQACCDMGDYQSMLHYALQQMELANVRQDDFMKSEAYLNISKAYERLADFSKAISYGRASLQNPSIDSRTPGYAHLAIAMAQMGFSQFQTSLEAFGRAMDVANETGDKLLELQVCVGLGSLFTLLRDLSKALIFLRNALSILQLVTVDNVHAKYKSIILYHLSVVLRIKGSLMDAKEACEEAFRLSEQTGGKSTYARSLCSLADINRELGESEAKETITKSWVRYENAFRIVRSINDRMGEVIVLGSMAKSASESRIHYAGQCECQAIQLNKKCLELAKLIGCKHAMMKCHLRLQELYNQLSDDDSEEVARKAATALVQEMELFCNFCGQRYGVKNDSLQALRCSHIFHERCLHKFLSEGNNQNCPKCQCKAILMDSISVRTSSISSGNPEEVEPVALTENIPIVPRLPPAGMLRASMLQATSISSTVEDTDEMQPSTSAQPYPISTFVGNDIRTYTARPVILIQQPSQDTDSPNYVEGSSSRSVSPPLAEKRAKAPPQVPPKPQPVRQPIVVHAPNVPSVVDANSKPVGNSVAKKNARPPPPPRKPCCHLDGFPPVPEEIFTESPSPSTADSPTLPNNVDALVTYRGPGVTDV